MTEQKKYYSTGCGITGISLGIFFPLVGLVLGIVGLSIKKKRQGTDIALNVISICLSVFWWIVWIALFME